jgi:hypothetical protein
MATPLSDLNKQEPRRYIDYASPATNRTTANPGDRCNRSAISIRNPMMYYWRDFIKAESAE